MYHLKEMIISPPEEKVPGFVSTVARAGNIVYQKVSGYAEKKVCIPIFTSPKQRHAP
jgi:hypothetical protein